MTVAATSSPSRRPPAPARLLPLQHGRDALQPYRHGCSPPPRLRHTAATVTSIRYQCPLLNAAALALSRATTATSPSRYRAALGPQISFLFISLVFFLIFAGARPLAGSLPRAERLHRGLNTTLNTTTPTPDPDPATSTLPRHPSTLSTRSPPPATSIRYDPTNTARPDAAALAPSRLGRHCHVSAAQAILLPSSRGTWPHSDKFSFTFFFTSFLISTGAGPLTTTLT
jgi:hypothetical protein